MLRLGPDVLAQRRVSQGVPTTLLMEIRIA